MYYISMKIYQKYRYCLIVCSTLFGAALFFVSAFVPAIAADQPDLTFRIDPTHIERGETAILSWFGRNIKQCRGYGDWAESYYYPDYTAVGLVSLRPQKTETYGLACSGDGGVVRSEVSVTVSNPGAASFSFPSVTAIPGGSIPPIPVTASLPAKPALTAGCAASLTTVAKGEKVTFVGSFNGGSGIAGYLWAGDVSGSSKIVEKTFSELGTKTVLLTVTDSTGSKAVASCPINVIEKDTNNVLGAMIEKGKIAIAPDKDVTDKKDCEDSGGKDEAIQTDSQIAAVGRAQSFVLWFVVALAIINFGFLFYISGRLAKLEKKHSTEVPV